MLKQLFCRRAANTAPTWRTGVIHAINLSERARTEFVPAGRQRRCGELLSVLRQKVRHRGREIGARVAAA
jgi:hypothetical protein